MTSIMSRNFDSRADWRSRHSFLELLGMKSKVPAIWRKILTRTSSSVVVVIAEYNSIVTCQFTRKDAYAAINLEIRDNGSKSKIVLVLRINWRNISMALRLKTLETLGLVRDRYLNVNISSHPKRFTELFAYTYNQVKNFHIETLFLCKCI